MELTGQYRIPAPPGRVWQALNDVAVLRVCIPGCEDLQADGEGGYRARVTARVGAVKASFAGRVALSDLDPPNAYTISGEGSGGAAGFAKGSARVHLAAEGDVTLLSYTAAAEVGGKLAAVGGRLLHGVAAKTADDFFSRFRSAVADGGPMSPAPARQSQAQPDANPAVPPERHGPAEPVVGNVGQVPPVPTVPYTLGQTPQQQNRVIVIGLVCWVVVLGIIYLSG